MSPLIIVSILLTISVALNGIEAKLIISAHEATARIQQAFDSFKAQVKVEGEAAAKKAADETIANLKRKKDADAENAKLVAAHLIAIAELRHQRDSARSSFLSSTAATASSADNACFNRTLYLGAYGELVKNLRGLADEGTVAVDGLNTARRWAQAPAP